ncbi:MAG: iron complex transport system ATP-binding protein [Woeseiaceae bacterium]|jgi:iron complex transport system ATP-binding protein|tara:strand:- start:14785 stop:15576 length:792 start_codon:yes stop_codon:yes gene_type:complete
MRKLIMSDNQVSIAVENIDISIPNRTLIKSLTLSIKYKEFIAILGQNGCGKSLTLHTLAGVRLPASGEVKLMNENITNKAKRDIAKNLALLTQDTEDIFPSTVFDSVLIGRHPHISTFNNESAEDILIARDALNQVGLLDLESRDITTLSGGERRRLSIAQVLTQQPKIFLLDEPTNHLDPQYQLEVLKLFKAKVNLGCSVITTMHDVNLAARYATQCLLIFGDGNWIFGNTSKILNEENLTKLYGIKIEKIETKKQIFFSAI